MPLGAETAARLDTLVPGNGPVVIGLSGGADSRALLILTSRWARFSGRPVHALVCDHAFREGSADDARRAAAMADAENIPVRIVRKPGSKPDTGLQAAARQWRLTELARDCHQVGADTLLLGHTADDRAETIWMRLAAGAGLEGLTAMRPVVPHPVWPDGHGLTIARPLIDQTRRGVRDWLSAQGLNWIDDPSNDDATFTRVRTRRTLSHMQAHGFDTARLSALAETASGIDDALAHSAAHLIADAARFAPWGGIELDAPALIAAIPAIRSRAIAAMIAAVSGIPLPAPKAVNAIEAGLLAGTPATGGGAALTMKQGSVWLVREPGRVPPADIRVTADKPRIWDGRWRIETNGPDVDAVTLGRDYAGYAGSDALARIPGLARPTLPVLKRDGTLLAVAGLETQPGIAAEWLAPALAARTLFAGRPPAWFDRAIALRTGEGGSRNSSSDAPYLRGPDLEMLET